MSEAQLRLSYDLAKKVPDMRRGFSVATAYGDIEVSAEEAAPFVELMQRLLQRRLRERGDIEELDRLVLWEAPL